MTDKAQAAAEYRMVPKSVDVDLMGKTYVIRKYGFGRLPRVTALLAPLFSQFFQTEGQAVRLDKILAEGGENVMELLAMAIAEERAFMDELDYDEGMSLLSAVVEVNKEQFAKKILPDLMKMLAPQQAPAGTLVPKAANAG